MISVLQQPYTFTPKGQHLIITASSTNVANTGFRYKLTIDINNSASVFEIYAPPNPANYLQFDLQQIVYEFCKNRVNNGSGASIHKVTGSVAHVAESLNGITKVAVELLEAWEVGGVLTDDPDADGPIDIDSLYVFNAHYQITDGYRPNPATTYALTANTSRIMSDRFPGTYFWDYAETEALTQGSTVIVTPARETDWGVWTIPADTGANLTGNDIANVLIGIVPDNGSPATYSYTTTPSIGNVFHLGLWPANLNASTIVGMVKPSDYPNWKYIYFRMRNSGGGQRSITYVMFNADRYLQDCAFDTVRIGWVNSRGGWDYFNFTMKDIEEKEIDRRNYRPIIGSYASTAFSFNTWDRGMVTRTNLVKQFLTAESDWLQEGEFTLLSSLVNSSEIHWVQDDGTHIPLVMVDTNYQQKKYLRSKTNIRFRFEIAQPFSA